MMKQYQFHTREPLHTRALYLWSRIHWLTQGVRKHTPAARGGGQTCTIPSSRSIARKRDQHC
eukprot:4920675-Pyramimonas_sp.AAC.1